MYKKNIVKCLSISSSISTAVNLNTTNVFSRMFFYALAQIDAQYSSLDEHLLKMHCVIKFSPHTRKHALSPTVIHTRWAKDWAHIEVSHITFTHNYPVLLFPLSYHWAASLSSFHVRWTKLSKVKFYIPEVH